MDTEFFQLFEQQRLSLMKITYNYFSNPHDAADALQLALIQGHKYYRSSGPINNFRNWIHRLTINVCHYMAKKWVVPRTVQDVPVPNIDQLAVADELKNRSSNSEFDDIFDLVDEMADHYRLVIIYKYVYKMNEEEISRALGIPRGTVKSRLNNALKILREKIDKYHGTNLAV